MANNMYNDDEAAPLLTDGNANGDDHKSASAPQSPVKKRLLPIWRSIRSNIKILTLTALLLGGVVALFVFIACTTYLQFCFYFSLTNGASSS